MHSRALIQLFFLGLFIPTIAVRAQLNVNFTADKTGGCSPLTVSFTNKTTGASPNAIYKWDLGNGNSSALVDPTAIYTDEKTYTVTLIVHDGNQVASKTATITVYQKPVVDFSASVLKGCVPLQVIFTGNARPGNGTISTYYWDFGDGSTQEGNSNNQPHLYNLAQKSSVSVTVTNSYGCHTSVQKKDFVETLPAIVVGFSADKTVFCKETDPVQFTNTSTGPGTLDYTWDFGDGTSTTQKDPSHAFNKKGTYTVMLNVNSSAGCTASKTQTDYLNVANYSTNFAMPARLCKGSTDTFIAANNPIADKMVWKVNGQVIAPINDSSIGYSFGSTGTYSIKLVSTFGNCPDSVTKQVQVNDVPDIRPFIADIATNCGSPATVNFKDTTPGAVKWEWSFESNYNSTVHSTLQAPTYVYSFNSMYTVLSKVFNAAGCSSSITQDVYIVKPHIQILYNSTSPLGLRACGEPLTVTFSVANPEDMASYEWDFGDNTTSTDPSPTHTYTKVGEYYISLKYVTKDGCSDRINGPNFLTVAEPLTADFECPNGTTVCGNSVVYFKNTSTGGWSWWSVDGVQVNWTSSPKQDMIWQFTTPGKHTIALTVEYNGCIDTIKKVDYITVLPPFAKIDSVKYTCAGDRGAVTMHYWSPDATTWTWDYGDGTKETLTTGQPSVTHTYAKSGVFMVKLTATNGQCEVSDSTWVTVLLKQYPQITGSKTTVCENEPLKYELTNLDVMNYTWYGNWPYFQVAGYNYSNGSTDVSQDFMWPYYPQYSGTIAKIQKNTEQVRVIMQDLLRGCYDTSNYIPVQVTGSSAGFEVALNNICIKDAAVFKDTSKANNSTITSWEWDFGDGQTSSHGGTVSHTYSKPGAYNVSLKITDASGCGSSTSSSTSLVTVTGPQAAFTPSAISVPLGAAVAFTNNTDNWGSSNTTYQWQVNGIGLSTDPSPSYTFDQPGSYTVKLTATNTITGCSTSASQVISVDNFNAGFNIAYTKITANNCPPVLVSFNNSSQNYSSIIWNFGDGTIIESVNNPTHIYEKAGRYIVTLNVTNAGGLQASYIDSVIIDQPEAVIQSSVTEACKGTTVTLNAIARNTGSFVWDFGDGSVIATTDTFATHQYSTPGLYAPVLLMQQSAGGCVGTAPLPNKINIRPDPVVTITPAQPLICKGRSVPLQASGGVTYEWLPANDLSDASIASPLASPALTSSYTVRVTDDIGCKSEGKITITVIQPVQVTISGKGGICDGETVNLTASGDGVSTYKWINDIAGLNNINIPNPVAKPVVTTTYTLTGSDAHNCFTDTTHFRIQVNPLPTVNAGPDIRAFAGEPVQLQATGSNDVVNWQWTPSTALSCTNCAAPVCTPASDSKYVVMVKNQYSCAATDTISVELLCDESRIGIPNGITPNGDGKNDVFMIKGVAIVRHLVIFNRWGQKVFERSNFNASDRSSAWNGTINAFPADTGTYVYFIEIDCPKGSFTKKGTLTLIR
jgi:gliding motility-associated-like protein